MGLYDYRGVSVGIHFTISRFKLTNSRISSTAIELERFFVDIFVHINLTWRSFNFGQTHFWNNFYRCNTFNCILETKYEQNLSTNNIWNCTSTTITLNLNFHFYISLWWLKRFYESLKLLNENCLQVVKFPSTTSRCYNINFSRSPTSSEKLLSPELKILIYDGLWENKKCPEESRCFDWIKLIDWYRLVNIDWLIDINWLDDLTYWACPSGRKRSWEGLIT